MTDRSIDTPSYSVPRRVLLLLTAKTYRAQPFIAAAQRLGIEVLKGIDMPDALRELWDYQFGLDFADLDNAVKRIIEFAAHTPFQAILAVDDSAVEIAAHASAALGLPHNSIEAAHAARDKHRMRELLAQAGVSSPRSRLYSAADDSQRIATQIDYPCVVKPRALNGSRGVMRANNAEEFIAAVDRLTLMLARLDPHEGSTSYLVEDYIDGIEVALEGMLSQGRLKVLALFDKPDPLIGPFFEETIYVTPSRLPQIDQDAIAACAADAARALGLREGSLHAELRINAQGPWIVEVAGRSIGGLCSQTLRFGAETDVSLEEMILRQALGMPIDSLQREGDARGVMMIPIPKPGSLKCVTGLEEAQAVSGVESIEITAKFNYPIMPLPEGDSYLGFIFARGESSDAVEVALRAAHQHLQFEIEESIPLKLIQHV